MKKNKVIRPVILSIAASLGATALVRWLQRRSADKQHQARVLRRMERVGTSNPPIDHPDRMPVPATGTAVAEERTMEAVMNATETEMVAPPVVMAEPMAEALTAFHRMIVALRFRRQHDGVTATGRSLAPEDMANFAEVIDRVESRMPDVGEGNLADGSLEERMFRLTNKVLDALRNTSLNDDDLFRLNGEVRSEACQLLNAIFPPGDAVLDARRLYECA